MSLSSWFSRFCFGLLPAALLLLPAACARAQESYFVTYSHQMEEPGNLEVDARTATAPVRGGDAFVGGALEFEYGIKAWWTTELYLDGQSTPGQSSVFTGFRWEHRIRPLLREHWINPVLYAEFEDLNGADKSLLEVVGHDGRADFLGRNDRSRRERELELRLILSSNFRGWNLSENFITEKSLAGEPWEFGYAVGLSRPLALAASPRPCSFCRENFAAGVELYGGLGDRESFGLRNTSHYLAPVLRWDVPGGPAFRISPGFGLSHNSHGFLLRLGVSYEIEQIAARLRGR